MEKTAYGLLLALAMIWLLAVVGGMIALFPFGLLGLVALVAFGLLFIKVLRERLKSREDDHYDRNVDQ